MDDFCEPRKPVPFKTSENTLRCCLCPLKISSRCRGSFHPFRATAGNVKKLGENGKSLPDEKKIAKPPFCRYSIPAFLSSTISNGQVSEWSNEHAWKVCVPQTGTEGSNPSLSAINFPLQYIRDEYIAVLFVGVWGKMERLFTRENNCRFDKHVDLISYGLYLGDSQNLVPMNDTIQFTAPFSCILYGSGNWRSVFIFEN